MNDCGFRKGYGYKMIEQAVVGIYLLPLSIWDVRRREVPTAFLTVGWILTVGWSVISCMMRNGDLTGLIAGMLPGIVMILVARLTGQMGYADGVVLTMIGTICGYWNTFLLLCGSLLLLCALSVIMLLFGKADRNTKMPYIPFLETVFLLQIAATIL